MMDGVTSKFKIRSKESESHSQWQNLADSEIIELKHLITKHRLLSNSPTILWEYLVTYCTAIWRLTVGR